MDTKLALLFLLIAAVLALSHLGDDSRGPTRRWHWREFVPGRRKS